MRFFRAWLASGTAGALFLFAAPVSAFERQWHLGGGLGFAAPTGSVNAGPALGLYGAYGLSDVFDLRLELQGSLHATASSDASILAARGGIAYKIDVIEWIPYVGVSAGSFVVTSSGGGGSAPAVGALAGLDYALSRHVGLGIYGSGDYVFFSEPVAVYSGFLRGEYRFGW